MAWVSPASKRDDGRDHEDGKRSHLLNRESHGNVSRKRLFFWHPSEEKIARHPLEQAQIRFKQKEVLLTELIVKTWFKKPYGNPQKKISDRGSKTWWCSGLQKRTVLSVPLHWDSTWTWWLAKIRHVLKQKALSSSAKCHYEQMMARLFQWWKQGTTYVPHDKTGSWLRFSTTSIAVKILGRMVKEGDMRGLLQVTQIQHTCLQEYI